MKLLHSPHARCANEASISLDYVEKHECYVIQDSYNKGTASAVYISLCGRKAPWAYIIKGGKKKCISGPITLLLNGIAQQTVCKTHRESKKQVELFFCFFTVRDYGQWMPLYACKGGIHWSNTLRI